METMCLLRISQNCRRFKPAISNNYVRIEQGLNFNRRLPPIGTVCLIQINDLICPESQSEVYRSFALGAASKHVCQRSPTAAAGTYNGKDSLAGPPTLRPSNRLLQIMEQMPSYFRHR